MAKASDESTPAPAGKLVHGDANFAGQGKLDVRKPVVAERSEFSKPAAKLNRKQHLEKAQDELRKARDAAELDDYLDELVAKSEPGAAPLSPAMTTPDPFRTGAPGRPGAKTWIEDEAKRRIHDGEIVPKLGGLTAFSKDLWVWWEKERQTSTPTRPSLTVGAIRNIVRPIWNAALSA